MSALDVVSKGILPFRGGLKNETPWFLEAAQRVAPMADWRKWSYHDMTCGSCSCSATFGFYGMSVTANDLAMRSYVTARAIFGKVVSKQTTLVRLLNAAKATGITPDDKSPAAELVGDFVHPLACNVFDAFFYASERGDVPEAEAAYYRYLAIRYVLLTKSYMYFLKLPTHDLRQLANVNKQWADVVEVLRYPGAPMGRVSRQIDHLIHAQTSAGHEREPLIMRGDCRENISKIDWSRPSFVGLNPPTSGNARFMQANKIIDTLLHNAPQQVDKGEMPADLWRSLILDTVERIPAGHYVFNYVGDGALTWEEGFETVISKIGTPITKWVFPVREGRNAGVVLMRRG